MYFLFAGFSSDLLLPLECHIKSSHYLSHIIDLSQLELNTLDVFCWHKDVCNDVMQNIFRYIDINNNNNKATSEARPIFILLKPILNILNLIKINKHPRHIILKQDIYQHIVYDNAPQTLTLQPVHAIGSLNDFSIDILTPNLLDTKNLNNALNKAVNYENTLLDSIQDILQEYDVTAFIENNIWYFNAPWLLPIKTYHPYQATLGAKSCLLQTWPEAYYACTDTYAQAQKALILLKKILSDIQITWHTQVEHIEIEHAYGLSANMLWPITYCDEKKIQVKSLGNYCIINSVFLDKDALNSLYTNNIGIFLEKANILNSADNNYIVFDETSRIARIFYPKL
jgi:hypothetical protein